MKILGIVEVLLSYFPPALLTLECPLKWPENRHVCTLHFESAFGPSAKIWMKWTYQKTTPAFRTSKFTSLSFSRSISRKICCKASTWLLMFGRTTIFGRLILKKAIKKFKLPVAFKKETSWPNNMHRNNHLGVVQATNKLEHSNTRKHQSVYDLQTQQQQKIGQLKVIIW